jgi:ATP-binding cassette, subfamily B (MDR/TAP), member 1
MTAFELQGDEMTSRGDFFALMFFVVALGNLVAYAVLGWYANIVSQVSSTYSTKNDVTDMPPGHH